MVLQSSDNLGINLVSVTLNGSNHIVWSNFMLNTLRAKDKLGFVNEKCKKPEESFANFEKWMKVDSLVIYWILNSISKDAIHNIGLRTVGIN